MPSPPSASSRRRNRPSSAASIRLYGVRQNNLKNFDLEIPANQLTVITGVSGSGKSSLAFDTLFAEGQRRYIETFSPYARQFFDRMDKPQVDRIEGIPPAIAVEQKNTVKSARSTVGTMTEICDYIKTLWLHFARPFCRRCGRQIQTDSPQSLWQVLQENAASDVWVCVAFPAPLSPTLGLTECLRAIQSQGFQRCWLAGRMRKLDDLIAGGEKTFEAAGPEAAASLLVIQDRIRVAPRSRARFIEACEQAFSFGKDRLFLLSLPQRLRHISKAALEGEAPWQMLGVFSRRLECAPCRETLPKPTRAFFSFNSPVGACPECRGFGWTLAVDYRLAIPDPAITLAAGAVKPWQSGHGLRSQQDLMQAAKRDAVPTDVPFGRLSPAHQKWVLFGGPNYGQDRRHRWPQVWYGVKGYFDWLESKAYKMHVRLLLARYRANRQCPACAGARFRPETLQFRIAGNGTAAPLSLPEFYRLPIRELLAIVNEWRRQAKARRPSPLHYALLETQSRLQFLADTGLAYLTLDRPTNTLSGGETERINLASCLGTRLVNTLFVLDEPSVGLHAVDVQNLIAVLHRLRDAGNTVVVVEHDAAIIRAADRVIDLGPGSGAAGGNLLFAGSVQSLAKRRQSATARFLGGQESLSNGQTPRKISRDTQWLSIHRATCHNLSRLSVRFPLNRLVCVTGVSGSGKTTLVKQVLAPNLERAIGRWTDSNVNPFVELSGFEALGAVVLIDQSPIGKTPRSNPALYAGLFEDIRKLFAASKQAEQRGFTPGTFSFNSPAGQCEQCRGAGFEKVEMQFLSDVFLRCPECNGNRYRRKVRDFTLDLNDFAPAKTGRKTRWTIVEMLKATVDEAAETLRHCPHLAARRAVEGLRWLQAVGLGYLRLGQAVNTLSGGESQRLKVVRHLFRSGKGKQECRNQQTLFLFDEPTTGLHFADIKVLLQMFRAMLRNGHSVLVIEHHLDFICQTDWIIDLGPGAGAQGGKIAAQGIPAHIAQAKNSLTGKALRPLIKK